MRTAADRPPSPSEPRLAGAPDPRGPADVPRLERRSSRPATGLALHAARGFAACAGVYAGVNLLVALVDGGADANHDWLDLRGLPLALRAAVEALACAGPLALAARPRASGRAKRLRELVLAGLGLATLGAGALQLAGGSAGVDPRPLLAAAAFLALLLASRRAERAGVGPADDGPAGAGAACSGLDRVRSARSGSARFDPARRRALAAALAGALLFAAGVPLAAIATASRPRELPPPRAASAGVAVVFGAGVSEGGAPSLALADRVRTAAALQRDGRVRELWCSGGPGPGAVHETEAMQRLAVELGVPEERVRRDVDGLSTWATAARAAAWARAAPGGAPRVFAVSHGYHLARVELAFQRHGLAVHTVPALETRPLARLPWYVAREVGGYWVYWTRRARFAVARP